MLRYWITNMKRITYWNIRLTEDIEDKRRALGREVCVQPGDAWFNVQGFFYRDIKIIQTRVSMFEWFKQILYWNSKQHLATRVKKHRQGLSAIQSHIDECKVCMDNHSCNLFSILDSGNRDEGYYRCQWPKIGGKGYKERWGEFA